MKSLVSIAIALAMAGSAVVHANGTILLTRPVDGSYQGKLTTVGEGLFTIKNDGTHLKQLTPWVAHSYYSQLGLFSYYTTRNFSPLARDIVYFAGKPSGSWYLDGKYRVMNLASGQSHRLFPGSNDSAAPGYGAVAWGPNGLIAYANSANGIPVNPHCVYLMRGDGSERHRLWCAPAQESTPQGMVPTLSVGGIRWAGNGKSLVATVYYQPVGLAIAPASEPPPVGGTAWSAVYKVNVKTGVGTEIATNTADFFDVSYDGSKVVYEQWSGDGCGNTNPEGMNGTSLCVLDLKAGHVTTINPPGGRDWWQRGSGGVSGLWAIQVLFSPNGSKLALSLDNIEQTESDLYVINTDGTGLRQITFPNPATPAGTVVGWMPVAWSADGGRILANRGTAILVGTDQRRPTDIHILNLMTGKNRRLTDGYAVDWHDNTSY